ncbi:MAG: hypothetical protein KF901_32940 [Myxococcales bacterium]|nr:hypothetical protein [Myxococcales bacterium]
MIRGLALGVWGVWLVSSVAGCASSVDLCGESAVCGQDGRTYHDRCAALAAGAEIAYIGACGGGCPPLSCELACTLATDESGCPRCACARACGADRECGASEECKEGFCTPRTPACGRDDECRPDQRCAEGRCVAREDGGVAHDGGAHDGGLTCPTDRLACSDECVNPREDVTNCGGCGVVCGGPIGGARGEAACLGGSCGLRCPDGYGDCDGVAANGCEKHTDTDPFYCGRCDRRCEGQCRGGECIPSSCREEGGWTITSGTEESCTATCGDVRAEHGDTGTICRIPGEPERSCTPPILFVSCLETITLCCGGLIAEVLPGLP